MACAPHLSKRKNIRRVLEINVTCLPRDLVGCFCPICVQNGVVICAMAALK